MIKYIKTVNSELGKVIDVYSETAKVKNHEKQLTTHVSGSGGGGYINNGYGSISNITINSQTVANDYLTLECVDGTTKSIKLINFDLITNSSDSLILISMKDKISNEIEYVAVYNDNNKSLHMNAHSLQHMFAIPYHTPKGKFYWTMAFMPSIVKSIVGTFMGKKFTEPGKMESELFQKYFNIEDYR